MEKARLVRRWLRNLAVAALALFILLGPGYRQVLEGKESRIPRWVMFSGMALGFIEVHFETVSPMGERRVVPFEEIIGEKKLKPGQRLRARRIKKVRDAQRYARNLCRKLDRGSEVYLTMRRSTRSGFKVLDEGTKNYCRPHSSKRGAKK